MDPTPQTSSDIITLQTTLALRAVTYLHPHGCAAVHTVCTRSSLLIHAATAVLQLCCGVLFLFQVCSFFNCLLPRCCFSGHCFATPLHNVDWLIFLVRYVRVANCSSLLLECIALRCVVYVYVLTLLLSLVSWWRQNRARIAPDRVH